MRHREPASRVHVNQILAPPIFRPNKDHPKDKGITIMGSPMYRNIPDDNYRDLLQEEVEQFIADSRWIFAKTMPQWPHEYTLCKEHADAGNEERFLRMVSHIRRHGQQQYFFGRPLVYLYVGDYKYWSMGAEVIETTLINRARIVDDPRDVKAKTPA